MRSTFITCCAIVFVGSATWAAEPLASSGREAALATLKANRVWVDGLTIPAKDGGPQINLGLAENGEVANNATDETLRLIAQFPELERVGIYYGKYTKDGLSALASLPNLSRLQIYKSDVPADAFAVLPKLTRLTSLSLGEYPVTDEVIGYAGQIKGLRSFDHTQSSMTPAGFLKFLDGVESLEQLTLFGDHVDDVCLRRIGEMKNLKRFWTNSKTITSAGLVHLAGLTKMEDLYLSETKFGDDDARSLEGMKDLKSLGLNRTNITDVGMESLAGLTKLHDLGLDGTKITDNGMPALEAMTDLENLYVGMTDVTAKGLAVVPEKSRMLMMRAGKSELTARQFDEIHRLYPKTQLFDPAGYWTEDRIKAAMKELGKEWPAVEKAPRAPPAAMLPKLPGKAPVFAIITKVDTSAETFNFFLLFDEIVNTETVVEDDQGVVKKRTADRVMTSRYEEKTDRPLKGSVVSTGEGQIVPRHQAMKELPGKLVMLCDDFDGLHPIYRRMLAKDTWTVEIEKPNGLRVESALERLQSLEGEKGVAANLFAEIEAADKTGILAALETDPARAGAQYRTFVEDVKQRIDWLNHTDRRQSPPSIGELSLVMLAPLDPRLPRDPSVDLEVAYRAIHQSVKSVLGEPPPRAELLRELLKAWMKVRLAGTREYPWMARQYGLQELAPELVAVVLDARNDATLRYQHLWPLADLAGEAELELLVSLLDCADVVDRGPGVLPGVATGDESPQQWRDVVLGILVKRSDENVEGYGFKYPNKGLMLTNPGIDFVFPDDETRKKALAKWKALPKSR
jgi:hypothetical protein